MRRGVQIAGTVLLVLYPLGIWAGISAGGGRAVGVAVLISLLAFGLVRRRYAGLQWNIGHLVVLPGLALVSILFDRQRLLLATPVVINAALLATFGGSLLGGRVPVVERFARTIDGDLSPERVAYCRTVTKIWCAFFVVNGSVALWLSLYGSLSAWGLYTGAVAYGLMGLLFVAEYTVRRLRFR